MSGLAAIAIVLPILVWQVWGFLAPAVDQATQRALRVFIVLATALFAVGVVFAYFVVLPAAITFLDQLRRHALQRPDPRELLPLVHLARAARLRHRLRDADLHPRARPDPRPQLRQAAPQPPARLRPDDRLRDPAARRSIPSRSLFETIPLLILFEASIWLAKVMERRWRSGHRRPRRLRTTTSSSGGRDRREGRLGGLGRARRGGADRRRSRRDRRRRDDRRGRRRRRPRARRAPRRLRDRPGLRQRALAHRVRGLRRLRRRPAVRALDRDAHPAQGRRSTSTTWSRSRPSARTSACARGSRRSATAASPGAAAVAAAATGLRAIVYLEVFGRDGSALERFHELARADRAPCSRTASASASRRMRPYTCTIEVYRACAELGLPQATHFAESAAERDWLVDGRGRLEPARRVARAAARGDRDPPARRPRACSDPSLMAAHCVHADAEEIALLAAHGVGVAHCPRSNGYLGCGVAPLAELRDAGRGRLDRDRQPRLDAVARPVRGDPHGDRRRAGPRAAARCAVGGARARARDARRRPRARDGRPHRLARARQAGRPGRDLARRTLRSIPWKILLRQPSWAALRTASQLLWWPANSAT